MKKTAILIFLVSTLFASASAAQISLSIDVKDAEVTDVLRLLATQSGVNIVSDNSIKPERVTLHLRHVTFEQALSALVHAHDLQVRREGNILIVGASTAMNRKYGDASHSLGSATIALRFAHAKADEVTKSLADSLPLGTVVVADKRTGAVLVTGDASTVERAKRIAAALDVAAYSDGSSPLYSTLIRLRYVKPSDAAAQLKTVLPDGTYVLDDRQNAVVITGNVETRAIAAAFLQKIDVPTPQVMLEVQVMDVTHADDSNVGVQFGTPLLSTSGSAFQRGSASAGPSAGTTYAFAGNSLKISAALNALVSRGQAQILATPRLVTLNNREADLSIGQRYPVVFYDVLKGGQQLQFIDVGVKLRITPTIGNDGSVTAEMHPEYSAFGPVVNGFPIVNERKVDATLRVHDNESIIVGGLLQDSNFETVSKLPGLGDLPIIGGFFRNRERHHSKDEIVFVITPHIL